MEKKGNWVAIGGVIFVIISIIIIIFLIISNQESRKDKKEELSQLSLMNLYLTELDSISQTPLGGDYVLKNYSNYLGGDLLKDTFTEVKNITINQSVEILCSSEGYYSTHLKRNITAYEKKNNLSKIYCYMDRIGKIEIYSKGKIKEGESKIKLILYARGNYQNIGVCTSWSGGIIDVTTNYSEVPKEPRFEKTIDKCFNLNISLIDGMLEVPFTIKSENINKLDGVAFFVFDRDYTFSDSIIMVSEYNGTNLGNKKDETYFIGFEEE